MNSFSLAENVQNEVFHKTELIFQYPMGISYEDKALKKGTETDHKVMLAKEVDLDINGILFLIE